MSGVFRTRTIDTPPLCSRVGNFRQKNYLVEDGKDGIIGLFRRNSGCSAEQKILGIPFRTVPQRRKMFGILCYRTKWDANSRNSDLNHSAEEKTTRNSVPKYVSDENMLSIMFAGAGFFVKLIVFKPFPFVPSFGIDSSVNLGMPRNEHFLPRNNGSCSESIPRNFFGTKFRWQTYSAPSECVLPPHQRRGETPDIGLASYSIIPLR